jgi:calcium-dependent protein kinase
VKLYEFYTDVKYYYLVTELVEGGELFDEIQRRKNFNEETAAEIISQLLSAIIYCHERGIVHRDLKPENILMGPTKEGRYRIKIIDFGTAQSFKKDTKLKSVLGTPYYIAPEVLLRNYDEKCDVWSCGVILYILLSGTVPFYGETDAEILAAVKRATFTFYSPTWNDISTEAKELVTKMLAFPPSRRISAHNAYMHKWITKRKFNKLNPTSANILFDNLRTFQVLYSFEWSSRSISYSRQH